MKPLLVLSSSCIVCECMHVTLPLALTSSPHVAAPQLHQRSSGSIHRNTKSAEDARTSLEGESREQVRKEWTETFIFK